MTQIARPDSTIQGARSLTGSTRHGALSDQSDSTFISGTDATDDILTLANLSDPGGNTGYFYKIRAERSSGTGPGTFDLWQGNPLTPGTQITSKLTSEFGITADAGVMDGSYELTTTEADAITDFTDLYVLYNKSGGTATVVVYEVFIEIPDVPVPLPTIIKHGPTRRAGSF